MCFYEVQALFNTPLFPDHPNIILNGQSSQYIGTDNDTNEDIYLNIYGSYRISDTPEGKIVKAKYPEYPHDNLTRHLFKEWKLEDEGKFLIICHRPSTLVKRIGSDREVYKNDLGTFYVYDTLAGKMVCDKSTTRYYRTLGSGYQPVEWLLKFDYEIDV